MSDPATTIDLIALADPETGAPDPDPNRDTAFDADEATDARHEYLIIDRSTEQIIVPMGAHVTACAAINVPVESPFDADEALPVTVVNLSNCPETGHTENASLPAPWRMSIEELDSWVAFYRTRLRGLGLGCGALTGAEQAHRADILRNIALRQEARRHSSFS
jgi:hypothetical protein